MLFLYKTNEKSLTFFQVRTSNFKLCFRNKFVPRGQKRDEDEMKELRADDFRLQLGSTASLPDF